MASKLKTLKDLQKDLDWKHDTYVGLRFEARKWVREIQWQLDNNEESDGHIGIVIDDFECSHTDYESFEPEILITWIKKFFNLK